MTSDEASLLNKGDGQHGQRLFILPCCRFSICAPCNNRCTGECSVCRKSKVSSPLIQKSFPTCTTFATMCAEALVRKNSIKDSVAKSIGKPGRMNYWMKLLSSMATRLSVVLASNQSSMFAFVSIVLHQFDAFLDTLEEIRKLPHRSGMLFLPRKISVDAFVSLYDRLPVGGKLLENAAVVKRMVDLDITDYLVVLVALTTRGGESDNKVPFPAPACPRIAEYLCKSGPLRSAPNSAPEGVQLLVKSEMAQRVADRFTTSFDATSLSALVEEARRRFIDDRSAIFSLSVVARLFPDRKAGHAFACDVIKEVLPTLAAKVQTLGSETRAEHHDLMWYWSQFESAIHMASATVAEFAVRDGILNAMDHLVRKLQSMFQYEICGCARVLALEDKGCMRALQAFAWYTDIYGGNDDDYEPPFPPGKKIKQEEED